MNEFDWRLKHEDFYPSETRRRKNERLTEKMKAWHSKSYSHRKDRDMTANPSCKIYWKWERNA